MPCFQGHWGILSRLVQRLQGAVHKAVKSPRLPVAPVRKEPIGVRVGAQSTAVKRTDPGLLQVGTREMIEVRLPAAPCVGDKCSAGRGIACKERLAHLVANFVRSLGYCRTKSDQQVAGKARHRIDRRRDNAGSKAAPARMDRRDLAAVLSADQYRQAISCLHDAESAGAVGNNRVRLRWSVVKSG